MNLNECFVSSLNFNKHPIKNVKPKIKKQYYCVLRSFLYEIDKNNFELFTIFLNLIGHVMEINPRKLLIIVENIDHLISKKEYDGPAFLGSL